jgi:23S rRNA (pseudouridine1915-N3)-methyltransferase
MIHADIIAAGKMKQGPLLSLWDDYQKRLAWKIKLIEINDRQADKTLSEISSHIDSSAFVFVLDETGKIVDSQQFSNKIKEITLNGINHIQFIIGPASGLNDEIRSDADFILSFGRQTWPHMLARVMLIEQIYRSQQILSGHPYHRD